MKRRIVFLGGGVGGMGTYTSTELLAMASPTATLMRNAYCSDCLTPSGTGSPVYYDGTKWRSTTTGIEATTDALTFHRSAVASGLVFSGDKLNLVPNLLAQRGASGGASLVSSGTGAQYWRSSWTAAPWGYYHAETGTTSTGAVYTYDGQISAGFYANATSSAYLLAYVNLTNLSTSGEEFSLKVGFDGSNPGVTLGTASASIIYDRGNVLGALNAGNQDKWLCVTRNASASTVTVSSITPSTAGFPGDKLEILYTPTSVSFYINGTIVGSPHTTNIPAAATLSRQVSLVKSAGTATRAIRWSTAHSIMFP